MTGWQVGLLFLTAAGIQSVWLDWRRRRRARRRGDRS